MRQGIRALMLAVALAALTTAADVRGPRRAVGVLCLVTLGAYAWTLRMGRERGG